MMSRGKLLVELALQQPHTSRDSLPSSSTYPDVRAAKDNQVFATETEKVNPPIVLVEAVQSTNQISLYNENNDHSYYVPKNDRPSRVNKEKGQERIKLILQNISHGTIDDPLFSSDSDEYQPDSSSSEDEDQYCKTKTKTILQKKNNYQEQLVTRNQIEEVQGFVEDQSLLVENYDGVEEIQGGIADQENIGEIEQGFDVQEQIIEGDVGGLNENAHVEEMPVAAKKKRKVGENVNPKCWARNESSAKRRKGEKYVGLKKQDDGKYKLVNERRERKLQTRCNCKNVRHFKCLRITENDRQRIFNNFWKGIDSWEAKKAVIASLVDTSEPDFRRATTDSENTRKNITFKYYIKIGEEKLRVCKKMFINTFDLGERSVQSWAMKPPLDRPLDDLQILRENIPETHNSEKRRQVKTFLESLPKMESHYCRANTSKKYLEPMWESKYQLFREYARICKEDKVQPASTTLFHCVFKAMNIGFFLPKKDQCETCIKYKLGKVSDENYHNHQMRKVESREEKERDKKRAEESNEIVVFAVDVQKVLTCPNIKASSAYYKTKLKVHNWSVYNLASSDGTCYVWHEGNGDLDSNVFASMLVKFLSKELENNLQVKEIVIWSDGCIYQNRCENVANALLHFSLAKNVTVYQKYLEVGHTQMEVDSMHSMIEKKIKKQEHFVPADYVRAIREARINPRPYVVVSLTYRDFTSYSDGYYRSIRPGSKKGDPCVTDLRCLQFKTDGHIMYKLNFHDDFQELPRRPRPVKDVYNSLKPLYSKPLAIQERKFKDLQELKLSLEEDYHPFYNNLLHGNCELPCDHIKN